MTVICLEGPSAVGKSTTAIALAERSGGAAIPQVIALFERPPQESVTWYFERQVDRWAMAQEHLRAGRTAILDEDPFQPLWYNGVYKDPDLQPLEVTARFYREQIAMGRIAFPRRYFVLSAQEATLRSRRDTDRATTGRRRGGFERHLRYIGPQRGYFQAMQEFCPDRVEFLQEASRENTIEQIMSSVADRPPTSTAEVSLALFDELVRWLQRSSGT